MKNFLLYVTVLLLMVVSVPARGSVARVSDLSEAKALADAIGTRVMYGGIAGAISYTPNSEKGIYSFPLVATNNPAISPVYVNDEYMNLRDGVLVGRDYYPNVYWQGDGLSMWTVSRYNIDTWEPDENHFNSYLNELALMAYDVTRDEIYVTAPGYKWISETDYIEIIYLYKLDYETFEMNLVGNFEETVIGAAFDKEGQLYVIIRNATTQIGELYKVDKQNAEIDFVGSTGVRINTTLSGFVYDELTDKFYWAANGYLDSYLYEVDKNSGNAELIITFPYQERFVGIFIYEELLDGAPADVTDLVFTDDGKQNESGKISFTVPATTRNGQSLSGEVSVKVYVGNELVDELTDLRGGQSYEKSVTISQRGRVPIRVILSNSVGRSQEVKSILWVGKDYPVAVNNLSIQLNENDLPLLSWDPVTETKNGGYLDTENLRYKIVRLTDNVLLEDAFSGTTYLDAGFDGVWNSYSYQITPYVEEFVGESQVVAIQTGKPHPIPYSIDFNAENFLSWNTFDLDGDGDAWYVPVNSITGESGKATSNKWSGTPNNDWLVSPPIALDAGTAYKLSYYLSTRYNSFYENLKVYYSASSEPEYGDEILLKEYENIQDVTGFTDEVEIITKSNAGGTYYLKFQSCSGPEGRGVILYEVALDLLANPEAPAAVTDLIIRTSLDGQGNPPVVIKFTAPSLTVSGNELTNPLELRIYRNDELATNITVVGDPIAAGRAMELHDPAPNEGLNTYRIACVNTYGEGLVVEGLIHVGRDTASELTDIQLERNAAGLPVLTWSQPVGIHNGYVDLYNLYYRIQRNNGSSTTTLEDAYQIPENEIQQSIIVIGEETIPTWIYTTKFVDETVTFNAQNYYSYSITPYYKDDVMGVKTDSEYLHFGNAYPTPYTESFGYIRYTQSGWLSQALTDTETAWKLAIRLSGTDFQPQDKDYGMAVCFPETKSEVVRLMSPKLDVSNLESPLLRFWFTNYNIIDDNQTGLMISVSTDEGETFTNLDMEKIYIKTSLNSNEYLSDGWNLYEISLEEYKGNSGIILGFDASLYEYGVAIDNISVVDKPTNDLKVVSFEVPSRIIASQTNAFEVLIKNSGKISTSDYTLSLYAEGEEIANMAGEAIAPDEFKTFVFNPSFNVTEVGKNYEFHVEINFEADMYKDDNVSQSVFADIERSLYGSAINLNGASDEGIVQLIWDAPVNPTNPVLVEESFEEYPAFIIDGIGEWTMIDVDKGRTINYTEGDPVFYKGYDNIGAAMAYQVFQAKGALPVSDAWNARTGEQVLASFGEIQNFENNDWLISPELNGSSQEIVFYAKGVAYSSVLERYRFYVSSEGKEISDFKQLSEGDFVEVPYAHWEECRYSLPEGTRYFAIQCVSANGRTFLLDDISFAKAGDPLTLLGYNVYLNDVKLNASLLSPETTEYIDNSPIDGGKTYTVTAVYAEGESNYSNPFAIDYTGISTDKVESIVVYSPAPQEIVVEGGEGLMIEVIGIDGSLVYRNQGSGFDRISLASGGYLVKVGPKVQKVIVK